MDRRSALLAGGGALAGLALAGCGQLAASSSPTAVNAVTLGLPGGELAALRGALVLEHAQLAAYTAVSATKLVDGSLRRDLVHWATVEQNHVDALDQEIRRQGAVPPVVSTGAVPVTSLSAALTFCRDLEETAGAMWLWFAQRAVGFDVRTATVSIMGAELRQLNGLRAALGEPVSAVAPVPLSVDAAVAHVAAFANGRVP